MLTKAQLKNPKQMATLGVSAVLALLCLWLAVAIIMQAGSEPENASPVARVPAAANINWNWFASELSVVEGDEVVQVISDQLADANHRAKLLGVLIASKSSLATLKVDSSPQAVYKVGDDIGSNTIIVEIQPYRIVVNQNGVNKQILLQKPESIIKTEQVTDSNQVTPEDGFALANMFGAVPVMIEGSAGFKMNNLSDEMKQLSDMQEGDTITHIDGVAIQDLLANPQKWITLSGSSSLPVTVIRQGQEETIYINAASLSAKMLPNLGFMP